MSRSQEVGKDKRGRKIRTGVAFTLIELMVVVVIIGILGVLAVNIYNRYVKKSRVSEAVAHLHDIKAKQEVYRGRFDRYAHVCDNPASCASWFYPTTLAVDAKQTWDPGAAGFWSGFVQLGFDKKEQLYFQYGTVSDGLNPGAVTAPACMGLGAGTSWFCVAARAQFDHASPDIYLELTSATDKEWQIGFGVNMSQTIPNAPCGCAPNCPTTCP